MDYQRRPDMTLPTARAVQRISAALRHIAPVAGGFAGQARAIQPTQTDQETQHRHHDEEVFDISDEIREKAHIKSRAQYEAMYRESLTNPTKFWCNLASQFHWQKPWDRFKGVCSYNFDLSKGPIQIEWFPGGRTNVAFNALDRHVLSGQGHRAAILWEGNDIGQEDRLTYKEVKDRVCQLANYFRSKGVQKGDRVCLYLPMVPELPIAMLACARIGAIHSVVFGGFSAESLAGRMVDAQPKLLLTCNAVRRGDKMLNLKAIADKALEICAQGGTQIGTCLVLDRGIEPRQQTPWKQNRDVWWQDAVKHLPTDAPVEWMDSEDPLFMLYTSGSTGKPKGVIHTTGGYMVYSATTFKYVFDYHPGDVFWCTADCGWITGHTYVTYGPLLCGATIVIFEGVPAFPDAGRVWQIVDKHKVTQFYTAPTAIRTLKKEGDHYVRGYNRGSLKLLGTVGEPINPAAWKWYFDVVGEGKCPIVDTWWQTETGAAMITPMAGAWGLKPGSATLPFFGVELAILDPEGREQSATECEGYLCIKGAWPGIARTLYGDHKRFQETYFSVWKGYYTTGDGCRRDKDGYIWLTGRVDDVINVSGHRISTGEVESALQAHPDCAEAAVVAYDHEVKGQGIYAFVSPMGNGTPELKKALREAVRGEIGAFAAPDVIHWAPALPKTRSGKIMRRILRKIAANKLDELGDISSLSDPSVVDQLIKLKGK